MPRPARAASRSAALSLLAWLLCLLLGPGPALPALHFALVAHRLCPEHGELEHIDAGANAPELASAPGALAARADASPSAAGGRSELDGHGHETCGVAGVGSSVHVPSAQRAAVLRLEPLEPLAPRGVQHAKPGIALLRYAPKLAPPAAA